MGVAGGFSTPEYLHGNTTVGWLLRRHTIQNLANKTRIRGRFSTRTLKINLTDDSRMPISSPISLRAVWMMCWSCPMSTWLHHRRENKRQLPSHVNHGMV